MAAVEVTISGALYDKTARTTQAVLIVGEASLTGLGVGGGPIIPPEGGGGQPPWPGVPKPPEVSHPIWPPNIPGQGPIIPPPGEKPPEPVQPPIEWKAVWHPTEGWIVVGIPNVPHPAPSAQPGVPAS